MNRRIENRGAGGDTDGSCCTPFVRNTVRDDTKRERYNREKMVMVQLLREMRCAAYRGAIRSLEESGTGVPTIQMPPWETLNPCFTIATHSSSSLSINRTHNRVQILRPNLQRFANRRLDSRC